MDPKDQIDQKPQENVAPEPQDPGYSNEDLKAPIREIASNTDEPKPEPKEPELPNDPIIEEPKIDAEQIAENAARKVIEEQEAKRQADEQERIAEEAKTTEEDEYAKWEKQFKEDKNRLPTYPEALKFVKDQAKNELRAEAEEVKKAAEAEQEKVKVEQAENNKRLDSIIDDELADLYKGNKLTPIKDPNNPSDQGVVEKKALFSKWAQVNAQRRAEGKPDILSATRIYEFYFEKPNAQPPGEDAPISGNRASAIPPSEEQGYTNADLKKPWSFFRK